MKARMFCPTHGKLDFDQIQIKNGTPICCKCSAELVFGTVRPRKLNNDKRK
jgi:hypothetical protein